MKTDSKTATPEKKLEPTNGWPVLGAWFAAVATVATSIALAPVPLKVVAVVCIPVLVICLAGFYIVNPNMSRVLVLFGKYKGSVRKDGLFWTNPFMSKQKISLRAHNFDGGTIKVNDSLGNPIEISAVVVWRVLDTARASFDVEDYEHFVHVQSDAALRSLATAHPYDDLSAEGSEITLRGSQEEVADELQRQLSDRLSDAGIEVIEARLNHLAYAQEIASAMLQRQQASAVIAARREIVAGAVGMVELALEQLSNQGILELDDERRATLVGNLLVVLCGQVNPTPVLNTGSLYS
ncbi:MAG: SPFH domain-containing protein [bacterium]|nr:SPFH domain-containing protein [bacterium]